MEDERHRTLTDDRGRQQNAYGRQWNVTGRNANDGRAQKERDRVKKDIFTVICPSKKANSGQLNMFNYFQCFIKKYVYKFLPFKKLS